MSKYFTDCTTAEELRSEYHRLMMMYHPDVSADPNAEAISKEINAEFESAFARLKDIHRDQ